MVRLPSDHTLRTAGPYAVRQKLEASETARGLFKDAVPVQSRYTLIPRTPLPRPITPELLKAIQLQLDATAAEAQED